MDYIAPIETHLYVGGTAVVLGLIARKGFKSDIVPPMSFSGAVKTFIFSAGCSYIGSMAGSYMKSSKVPGITGK